MLKVSKGKRQKPRRMFVYGPPGVGKSTFASMAPGSLFIPLEDGVDNLDVSRLDKLESWDEYESTLSQLIKENHSFKWIVTDSADWLEKLIFADIVKTQGVKSVGDVAYGRGYEYALGYWQRITNAFDLLRDKGVGCIFIGHAETKRHEDPETESFDRFVPRLHKKSANHLVEWCDEVLFARFETRVRTVSGDFGQKQTKAVGESRRVLRCDDKPTATAKNRLGLPAELPLEWSEFAKFLPKTGA